ncbi:MAG TPA: tetratricopeptide repeat protein, partial [Candidatus Acidoferrum sp.]|nr:tetratricopeptide repeat protein [Candidatus Acidoferrum sp.]
MTRKIPNIRIATAIAGFLLAAVCGVAQQPKAGGQAATGTTVEKAMTLARQGRCREALPVLKKALVASSSREERKSAGVMAVRCAMGMDDRAVAGELLGQLGKQFSNDPDVLYVMAHAYSDLSMRAAGDLAQKAPQSAEARQMGAEALEVQGKWDEAAKEYEAILAQDPRRPGIHFRIARLLLSKPDAGPEAGAQAREELKKELEIDPRNSGAEFVLGELAKRESDWEKAAQHFSRTAELDPTFGDAFMEWGFALNSMRQFEKAVAPLQAAVRLQPGNPSAHYN